MCFPSSKSIPALTIHYIHSEDPLDLTGEMLLLKALGGHDLSQQVERAFSHAAPNTSTYVPLNDPLRYLKAPKAKGHSEPVHQAHVPKGDHKALVVCGGIEWGLELT